MGGRRSYGFTVQERTKRLLEALLAYANQELEGSEQLQIEANWQAGNKLVVRTKVRFLEELTAKYQQNGKLDTEQIKEALKRLQDWLDILEDNRTKTKGSEDWHFTLKLWSKDKDENLRRFECEWESRRAQKSNFTNKKPSFKNSSESNAEINWQQVCQNILKVQNQKRLTTNPLTTGDGVAFGLDEIYVPLGLVERKQRSRVIGDIAPEQGSQLYEQNTQNEIVKTFQHEQFFEQVLRQERSRRIAIIGEPGAGKTTLLQKIAAWVLDNTEDVVIWISLADLQGKNLEQYLLSDWLKAATRKVRVTNAMQEALGQLFNNQRVWLLLDAVDEMVVEANTGGLLLQAVANQLTGWVADAKIVLTCRLNIWDAGKNALEAFETYRNLDFSYGDAQTPDQVGQFIHRWFKSNLEQAERLRTQLDQPGKERIKDTVKNPLRLALLCRAWSLGQGKLPNTKAGLYQQFTDALYEWKQERFPTTTTQRQELNRALGELAKRAIATEKTKFRLRHHLVCSVLGKPNEELFQLALQLGWINQVGVAAEAGNRGEKVYAFYHPTFQEYFAALAIDDWHYFLNHIPHNPAQGTYRIFEPQWKEVILLWLGREDVPEEQKDEFIKTLIEFKDGCADANFYGDKAYLIAAAGLAEFGKCSRADEIITQMMKWGFGYFDIEKQAWLTFFAPDAEKARAALKQTDSTRAIAALVQLIESTQDESIRRQAVDCLGKISTGDETAITVLVQLIASTKNEFTCRQAADSLGKVASNNSKAITALVKLIETTENEYTRWQAVDSLGRIGAGNREAIAALLQLIEATNNEYTCWKAADTLGQIDSNNQTAIAALMQLIESTKNEYTRWQAADSLGKIDSTNLTVITAIVELIQSTEDKTIRWQATDSLREFSCDNETAIAALEEIINSTEDEKICYQVAYSLGEIDSRKKTAIAVLIRIIQSSEDEQLRCQAAYGLGKITGGNVEALTALLQLIKSTKDKNILREAIYSLAKIGRGSREALVTLVQLIESTKDEYVHSLVAESLGQIGTGNPETIAALLQLIQSTENGFTRWQAIESLGQIGTGNPEAIAALVQLIQSTENESTRRRAADSLGQIDSGNQTAITALVQLIESTKDESTCMRTVDSLKKILQDEQLLEIVTVLKDYLSDETQENAFRRYHCYEVIWHCAQNMTYPAFYQAWHNQPIATHSALLETKSVSSTFITQNINLAKLPQTLTTAIANESTLNTSIHLICVNGSKFIDRDNPAAKIYAEMVKSGCPKCEDGTPKTMAELQIYWDLLDIGKHVVLVFYESTSLSVFPLDKEGLGEEKATGFSKTFLNALSKFDGAICLISTQVIDNIVLPCFRPNQPIAEVVAWLKKLVVKT